MIPTITFDPDAGDSFFRVLDHLRGWWVEVTPISGKRIEGRLRAPDAGALTYDEVWLDVTEDGQEYELITRAKEIRVL